MTRKTADERFLLKLYQVAKEEPLDPKELGFKGGMTKTIVQALARGSYIKKGPEGTISITQRGIEFVQKES